MSRSVLIVACLVRLAAADPFEPPSHVAAAQEHYLEGKRLFAAKQYADAAAEFAQAVDLDADAKFLLFDLALARRMAGACEQAIATYRAFLDAQPPERYAGVARIGIDKCEQVLAAKPAAKPHEDKPPPLDQPKQRENTVLPPPPPPPPVHEPWYRDPAGDLLVASGIGCGIAAGVLYALARGAASDTFDAATLPDFHDRASAASGYQTASFVVGGVGAALVAAGAIRYATRPPATIAVAPTRGGAAFALAVSF